MDERTIVIVGAGLAAARAAVNLRKEGFEGRIVMLGEEDEPPYERPPLSKEYLREEKDRAAVRVKTAEAWADDDVELVAGTRATELDLRARAVVTDDGRRWPFWRALLATGSEARPLSVPGADLPGVMTLRTFDVPDTTATQIRFTATDNQCTGSPAYQGELDNDPLNATDCDTASDQGTFLHAAEFEVFG